MAPELDRKQKTLEATDQKLSELEEMLDEADREVFGAFCAEIRVESIREYEDVQLRMAREETEAMEKYATQKARCEQQ